MELKDFAREMVKESSLRGGLVTSKEVIKGMIKKEPLLMGGAGALAGTDLADYLAKRTKKNKAATKKK